MKYDTYKNETYDLYTIETDKFKSARMEVIFRKKVSKEDITYQSFLSSILMENCNKFPSKKELTRKEYELYNASIYAVTSRVGNTLLSNYILEILDPKYIDKTTLNESIELLFEMILNPNAENGAFDELTFDRVKNRLSKEIESVKEDPKQSSILDSFRELDPDSPRSWSASGDLKILKEITPKKLYDYYCDFLENCPRDIYLVGNLNMEEMNRIIGEYANFKSIPEVDSDIYLDEIHVRKTREVHKTCEWTQTNLVEIYALTSLDEHDKNYVLPLFNMLWGSGSLESRLYKSLREENSLCYNVSTFYQKYDAALVLHTAIDEENVDTAKKLIRDSLSGLIKEELEEEELENVKNLMITSLHLVLDSPSRLIDSYLFKNIAGLPDLDTRVEEFRKVTTKEISQIAKKLKLALIFTTRSER